MKVQHNGPAHVQFGDHKLPVSIGFDTPFKRMPGKGVINLNTNEALELVQNKPALFRRLEKTEGVPLPPWAALKDLQLEQGFDFPTYEDKFPDGAIARTNGGTKTLPSMGDLFDFLAGNPSNNNVLIQRPEHFRYGSVSVIPKLASNSVPGGVIRANVSDGQLPHEIIDVAARAVAASGADYAKVSFFLLNTPQGERPVIVDVDTRFQMEDAEQIAKLCRHVVAKQQRR